MGQSASACTVSSTHSVGGNLSWQSAGIGYSYNQSKTDCGDSTCPTSAKHAK